jgi:serine/threonine protein kinase
MVMSKTCVSPFVPRSAQEIYPPSQVNILIDDGCHVQLCDFGLVVVGDTTEECFTATSHGHGTKSWMSPQRLTGSRYRRTTADDVYAYACLCYYVSTTFWRAAFRLTQTCYSCRLGMRLFMP